MFLAIGGGDGDDGDLGFGFLVDFGAERGELCLAFGGEHIAKSLT